jgi:septal ring factor EnvC (AmiA/AmiB activator)
MTDLKDKVYDELGIMQLREKLRNLNLEIATIDTQILQLAHRKSYLQSDLCNLNREISYAQALLEPKRED